MGNKKKKFKHPKNDQALLPNAIFAVRGAKSKKASDADIMKANMKLSAATRRATEKAVQMAKIEKYAKENKISITAAMIHFM